MRINAATAFSRFVFVIKHPSLFHFPHCNLVIFVMLRGGPWEPICQNHHKVRTHKPKSSIPSALSEILTPPRGTPPPNIDFLPGIDVCRGGASGGCRNFRQHERNRRFRPVRAYLTVLLAYGPPRTTPKHHKDHQITMGEIKKSWICHNKNKARKSSGGIDSQTFCMGF